MAISFTAQSSAHQPTLSVVESVDLDRYRGIWYEIARLPNSFQKKCSGEVTATYTLLAENEIQVVNRCRMSNGEFTVAEGKARRASPDLPASKLQVRFAPWFLSFLPFVWGDYWILELAPDYSYAVIGEPSRTYFWILSRTPKLEESTVTGILERAKENGFDVSKVERTPQN